MSLEEIKREYQWIGTANSTTFKQPEGEWVMAYRNWSGTYEIFVCHELKQYYDIFSD